MLIRRLLATLLGAGLTLAAGAAGAQTKPHLPSLGGSAQSLMTPQQARQYGSRALRQLRARHMVVDDPLVDAYINDVGYRLVAHSDKPSQKYTFFVVDTPAINAFAIPGGFIGVNAGLIDMTQSESELAAVMAHEIGHITQHSMMREVAAARRDLPLTLLTLLGAIAAGAAQSDNHGYAYGYHRYNRGDNNAVMGVLAAGMGLVQQRRLNFSRSEEIEADRTGIRDLAASGYNPMAMAKVFQHMENMMGGTGKIPALLQTHPVTSNRIADARARARMLESKYKQSKVPPISLKQWKKITAPISYVSDPSELTAPPDDGKGQLSLYKLMRARVRVLSLSPRKAMDYYHRHKQRKDFDTPFNHYGYALALTRYHRPKKAMALLKPLVASYPSSLPLKLAMANALDKAGHTQKALAMYASLNQDTPHNRAIVMAYANALIDNKSQADARKAAGLLKPLLDNRTEPELFQTYARASEMAGNKVNAAEAWANASYLSGRPFDAMQQLKRILKQKNLNYYQRARIQADVNQLRPILLQLQKEHIHTKDSGDRRRTG